MEILTCRRKCYADILADVEHLFRPYDLVRASERDDIQEKVHDVNATIEGLFEFWMDYYGKSSQKPTPSFDGGLMMIQDRNPWVKMTFSSKSVSPRIFIVIQGEEYEDKERRLESWRCREIQ